MKLRLFGILAIAMLAVGVNASVAFGGDPAPGNVVVTPKSGPVGTTVHVIVDGCGEINAGATTQGVLFGPYVPGTGQLIVHVDGWPPPFDEAFVGGVNNQFGVAVATFQVPDVDPGVYTIEAFCQGVCDVKTPTAQACVEPEDFGPYDPVDFTVTAAPAEAEAPAAVTAGATTTG